MAAVTMQQYHCWGKILIDFRAILTKENNAWHVILYRGISKHPSHYCLTRISGDLCQQHHLGDLDLAQRQTSLELFYICLRRMTKIRPEAKT